MMKTPEEIKRAKYTLELCRDLITFDPVTGEDIGVMFLSEDNRDLYNAIGTVLAYIRQLEREKEALINDIRTWGGICTMCKHYTVPEYLPPCVGCCILHPNDRDSDACWEWRGVKEDDRVVD